MALTTAELSALDRQHMIHPQTNLLEHEASGPTMIIARGEGIFIEDADGKRYIDGSAALWNVNVGHGRRELAQAAYDQMSSLAFAHTFGGLPNPPAIRLARKVAELAPGDMNR